MGKEGLQASPLEFHLKYGDTAIPRICCIRNELYGHVCIAELDRDAQGHYGIDWVNPRRMATIAELRQIMIKIQELTPEEQA